MTKRSFVFMCAARVIAFTLFAPASAQAANVSVPAGGDLQAALDAANPGDTILLTAGATYEGNFVLPVHGGTTYVTIRTAGNDALLPAAGVRITPLHAKYLAKLRSPNADPVISTAAKAAYWRIMFLEFLANGDGNSDVVKLGDSSPAQNTLSLVPHHLTVDRIYMHGDTINPQKRGIHLNSASTTIINSWIDNMKYVGQDSQAIAGSNGPGPFRIENNHLEAAGNVFIYGGADPKIPGLVPADLTFRGNTLTRRLSWRNPFMSTPTGVSATSGNKGTLPAGTYGYRVVARRASGTMPTGVIMATSVRSTEVTATVGANGCVTIRWNAVPYAEEYRVYGRTPGGASSMFWTVQTTSFTDDGAEGTSGLSPTTGTVWQVKNLFELKNLRRAQVDFNFMENNWLAAQSGIAVLFTVRNQDGTCTQCVVEDVTFEYNIVRNMGGGFTILGQDYNHPSQQANNIFIRNNEFSGIDSAIWGGNGYFVKISGAPRDITIDHNTIISPHGSGIVSLDGEAVLGFVFTNNVARHNSYGIQGTGHGYGDTAISFYLPNADIRRNVLAGGKASVYPTDNLFPTTTDFEAQFVDYAGDDYALVAGSPWIGLGTDGKNLGADIASLRRPPPPGPPQIVTTSLPSARALQPYATTLQAISGAPPYRWSVVSGALPAGIVLDANSGTLSGTASAAGDFVFTARVTDSANATDSQGLTLHVSPAIVSNKPPTVTLSASSTGVVSVGKTITFTAHASDTDGAVTRVDFYIGGQSAGSDTSAPFTLNWVARDGGPFSFTARATDDDGATAGSAALSVQTTAEIVIYADDVVRMIGDYQLVADATAAVSRRLWNPNRGATKIMEAAASPSSYAEFKFYAETGRPYRIWIRGCGEANSWANDSAFLQFSGTVTSTGAAANRIGTTSSWWYSVEEYSNAGIAKWGWQDNGYGLNVVGASLYFERTGAQTIRIQQREDGLSIDQIVISPVRYFSLAPGVAKNDTTIVGR